MPPKRHPLMSHFLAAHPAVGQHAARISAVAKRHGLMGGIGGHGLLLGGATHRKRHTVGHAKNSARGAVVRQVMAQHGMTLPQASHYVKAHGIPY